MSSRAWAVAVAAALLVAACTNERAAQAPAGQPAAARGVRVDAVGLEGVRETVEVVGAVRSRTQTLVASKVQGYVREVRVREGDRVEPGALLVTVDERELRAGLDRDQAAVDEAVASLDEVRRLLDEAEAALRSARADHEYAATTAARYRRLADQQLVAAQDYEQMEARRKSAEALVEQGRARILSLRAREQQGLRRIEHAQAQLRISETALGDTRIVAPSTGVVVSRRVEPGNVAIPGQPLLVLDDPLRYRFEAEVGESEIRSIRLGQRVPVTLDAIGQTLDGTVVEIVPASDPSTHSVTVKLELPTLPVLRSGLFGRAGFPVGERMVLLVPAGALVERGQLTGVYVVDDQGVARLRLITAGARHGDRIQVLSGIHPGERLVVAGVERVTDGGRVETAP